MRVPWLSKQTIEMAAEGLLGHYRWKVARPVAPPIPVEDIVEKHLKLRIEFDDLHVNPGDKMDSGNGRMI